MKKEIFTQLLHQTIYDYEQCTEDDERSDVIQKLIDELYNRTHNIGGKDSEDA